MARSRVHNVHGLRLTQSTALSLSYRVDEQPRHVSWTFLRPANIGVHFQQSPLIKDQTCRARDIAGAHLIATY